MERVEVVTVESMSNQSLSKFFKSLINFKQKLELKKTSGEALMHVSQNQKGAQMPTTVQTTVSQYLERIKLVLKNYQMMLALH